MDHDHGFSFAVTTGPSWVRMVVGAASIFLVASALLRPVVTPSGRNARLAVTLAAGVAVLLQLLLTTGLDMPRQAVVGVLVVAGVPIAVTRHRGGAPAPSALGSAASRAAVWVVAAAAVAAGVELARARWGAVDPAAAARLLDTGVLAGTVGLSWLAVCPSRSRAGAAATNAVGWVLGSTVLAGVTAVAVANLPA